MLCLLNCTVVVVDTSLFLSVFNMPLYCICELTTVRHHKYSAVHSDFIQNRERLCSQHEFTVQFLLVEGFSKVFAARRSDTAYFLFDVKRGRAKKKTFEKILSWCGIFHIDLSNFSARVDLKIHHCDY